MSVVIDKTRFEEMLRVRMPNFRKVIRFKPAPMLEDGENMTTTLTRIHIDCKLKDRTAERLSVVLKMPFANPLTEQNEYAAIFQNENDVYLKILPVLHGILLKFGFMVKFAPECYRFTKLVNYDYVLMSNLYTEGYKGVNRLVGLSDEHVRCTLFKLAQWHAASAKAKELDPHFADDFRKSFFAEEDGILEIMNNSFEEAYLFAVLSYKISPRLKNQIRLYQETLTPRLVEFGKVKEGEFNVLNHGDFWIKNLMFKYNPTTHVPQDVRFVDFQLPKYGSPAMDLFSFLLTSPKFETRLTKFNNFLRFYHESLVSSLNAFFYEKKIPTLLDLQNTLRLHSPWAFVVVQRFLPLLLVDPYENSNLETFLGDNMEALTYKQRLLLNPRYAEQAEAILPWLAARTYL